MKRTRLLPGAVCLLVVMAIEGCAAKRPASRHFVRPLPREQRSQVVAGAMTKVHDLYLAPERIDPPDMLDGAVVEIARALGIVVREDAEDRGISVGEDELVVSRAQTADLDALAGTLDAIVARVSSARPDVPVAELRAAALRGAVRRLDRWSSAVAGKDRTRLLDNFRGATGGVGCRVGRREGKIRILEVYAGTPAAQAGMKEGDEIIAIGGEPVAERSVQEVAGRLRGDDGTAVSVTVLPEGGAGPVVLEMTRRRFVIPTVRSRMLSPRIGYLAVTHLSQNSGVTAVRLLRGIAETARLGGIVLDLRGNTGGSLLAAGQIADEFVDRGMLAETRGRDGGPVPGLRHRIAATPGGEAVAVPVVVLVDETTGSNAELLAAAIAWNDRGIVVGEKTFGKAVVQKIIDLGSDVTVKLTVARNFAAGRPLPDEGIEPDIRVDAGGPRCPLALGEGEGARPLVLPPPPFAREDAVLALAGVIIEKHAAQSRVRFLDAVRTAACAPVPEPPPKPGSAPVS